MNKNSLLFITFFILCFYLAKCNGDKFLGSSTSKKKNSSTTVEEVILDTNKEEVKNEAPPIETDPGSTEISSARLTVDPNQAYKRRFWVVTYPTPNESVRRVYYMKLKDDEPTVETKKQWIISNAGGGGARTYVTEAGLVFTSTGPKIHWVHPENDPEDKVLEPKWQDPAGLNGLTRGCVVSYQRNNGDRFVGMGWTRWDPTWISGSKATIGTRMFVEFPIVPDGDTFRIDFSEENTKIKDLGEVEIFDRTWYQGGIGGWGYSCYMDQTRKYFYGAAHNKPSVVDLSDPDPANWRILDIASAANNGSFVSQNLGDNFVTPAVISGPWTGAQTYAMAGDDLGNVLTGRGSPTGKYTYAFEPKTKTIWSTVINGGIGVYPQECFYKNAVCENFVVHPLSEIGLTIGPISALRDGNLLGLLGGDPGSAYLLTLTDPNDIKSQVKVTPISGAEITGTPYMYTDFTGATLYPLPVVLKFDFTTDESFASANVKEISFTWQPKAGKDTTMNDIKTEAHCYMKGADLPAFETIAKVENAGQKTVITASSCKLPFEILEIQLTQLNNKLTLFDIDYLEERVIQTNPDQ